MIWTLVRRDRATLFTGLVTLWVLLMGTMLTHGFSSLDLERPGWLAMPFLISVAMPWLSGLFATLPLQRASEMLMPLPLPGRTLAMARLAALALYALLPTAAAMLVFGGWMTPGRASIAAKSANVGMAALLSLVLVQALSPARSVIRLGLPVVLTGLVGVAAVAVALSASTTAPAAIYLCAATVLAFVIYRQTPAALELAPRADTHAASGRASYSSVNTLLLGRLEWGVLIMTATLVAGIAVADVHGASPQVWIFLPIIGTFVAAKVQTMFSWLDPLPVPRWRVLALALLPMPLAIAVGIGVGASLRPAPTVATPAVRLEFECLRIFGNKFGDDVPCYDQVVVPREEWRLAWNGNVPAVTLPSGEQVRPPTRPLFWGVAHAAYNPYSIEPTSSTAFVAHQMSRAIESVYGVAIPASELAERYLRGDSRARIETVGDGLTYVEDYGLAPRSTATHPPVAALLCAVVWLVSAAVGLRFGMGLTPPARAWRQSAVSGAVLAVAMGLVIAADSSIIDWMFTETFVLLRSLLPSTPAAAWAAVAAVVLVLFLGLLPLMQRLELRPTPDKSRDSRWKLVGPLMLLPMFALFWLGTMLFVLDVHGNASTGSARLLRLQLLLGADVEQRDDRMTLLQRAAFAGESAAVRVLLEHGARVDARSEDGRTALHVALSYDESTDRLGTLRVLLDHRADANGRSQDGRTPLMDAVDYERTRVFPLLLARGADPEVRDSNGRTALERAIAKEKKRSERVLRDLLARH